MMGSMGSPNDEEETAPATSLLVFLVVLLGGSVAVQVLSRLLDLGAIVGAALFSALPIVAVLAAVHFTARHPSP